MSAHPTNAAIQAMRAATQDIHRALENKLIITQPNAGKTEYLIYISAMWGWLTPFEQQLWNAEWPTQLHAAARSQKRLWLQEDICHAADIATLDAIPRCPGAPSFASMAERCGWAYVIEGAQLGGQVLRKSLAPALDPWTPRWLQGYGPMTATHWKSFIEYCESLKSPDACQAAARAAHDAFHSLAVWLGQCGALLESSVLEQA